MEYEIDDLGSIPGRGKGYCLPPSVHIGSGTLPSGGHGGAKSTGE
jgi:hypothetical protein